MEDVGTGEVVKALAIVPFHGAVDDTGDLVGRIDAAGQCGFKLEGRAVEYSLLTSRAVGDSFTGVDFFHGVVVLLTGVVLQTDDDGVGDDGPQTDASPHSDTFDDCRWCHFHTVTLTQIVKVSSDLFHYYYSH